MCPSAAMKFHSKSLRVLVLSRSFILLRKFKHTMVAIARVRTCVRTYCAGSWLFRCFVVVAAAVSRALERSCNLTKPVSIMELYVMVVNTKHDEKGPYLHTKTVMTGSWLLLGETRSKRLPEPGTCMYVPVVHRSLHRHRPDLLT